MLLSEHFDSSEFDCHCGQCGGQGEKMNVSLIRLLEKLRADIGGYPIYINSGFRCWKHNFDVGGVADSQHMKFTAADLACPSELTYLEFYHACCDCDLFGLHFDGIGWYFDSNFVHVDVRNNGLGVRVCW